MLLSFEDATEAEGQRGTHPAKDLVDDAQCRTGSRHKAAHLCHDRDDGILSEERTLSTHVWAEATVRQRFRNTALKTECAPKINLKEAYPVKSQIRSSCPTEQSFSKKCRPSSWSASSTTGCRPDMMVDRPLMPDVERNGNGNGNDNEYRNRTIHHISNFN